MLHNAYRTSFVGFLTKGKYYIAPWLILLLGLGPTGLHPMVFSEHVHVVYYHN